MSFNLHSYDDRIVVPHLSRQLELFAQEPPKGTYFSAPTVELESYDHIIVCMSGGKDSIACLLHLIDLGVDKSRVELWHHDVDGREGSGLMDWAFMRDFNKALRRAFNVPVYFSWLEHGFEGEMLKHNSISHPYMIETPVGLRRFERNPNLSRPATRRKFPQQAASLTTRWCSSALKIDVGRRALNNQDRFLNKRTLFVTGERRQESASRARYNQLEHHNCFRSGSRVERHVEAWRPVLDWSEAQVWEIFERHNVIAPVPYRLGWNRSSCMTCIFNQARIWATLAEYFPDRLKAINDYELEFACTISRSGKSVAELAKAAKPFQIDDEEALLQAVNERYTLPVRQSSCEPWKVPAGAFRQEQCGAS